MGNASPNLSDVYMNRDDGGRSLIVVILSIVLSIIIRFSASSNTRYSKVVDWREEVLKFIEEKIKILEKKSVLKDKEVDKVLSELPSTPRGFTSKCLGEDRGGS